MSHCSATWPVVVAIRTRPTILAINHQLTIRSNLVSTARSSGCSWEWVPLSRCLGRYIKQKSFSWHLVPDSSCEESGVGSV